MPTASKPVTMLSRIGNSLFWMGRYLERAEHISRYVKVHYLTALDAPAIPKKDFVLESIVNMACDVGVYGQLRELDKANPPDILVWVYRDLANANSVFNAINLARENARSSRDILSTELWEAINKFYHSIKDYPTEKLRQEGPFDLGRIVDDCTSGIKGLIDNSLLHNETWHLISLGMHLERAAQVCRILINKLNDIQYLEGINLMTETLRSFQLSALLRSAESFDMSRKNFRSVPSIMQSVGFLTCNPVFPKSVRYNLEHAAENLEALQLAPEPGQDTPEFALGKLCSWFSFLTMPEIEEQKNTLYEKTLMSIYQICAQIEEKYLSF